MAYSSKQIETIFNTICERIEEGESLRSVLRDEDMPSSRTFFKWIDSDESKVKQYARATDMRADAIFDEMFDISDTPLEGITLTEKETGTEIKRGDMLGHRRLQVDTRKWALSKMNPKKYGDKIGLEHSGEIATDDLSKYSTEELKQRYKLMHNIESKNKDTD